MYLCRQVLKTAESPVLQPLVFLGAFFQFEGDHLAYLDFVLCSEDIILYQNFINSLKSHLCSPIMISLQSASEFVPTGLYHFYVRGSVDEISKLGIRPFS